jgi:hypothetical protein
MLDTMVMSAVSHVVVHERGFLLVRSLGVAGGLVAFVALVLRHPARREGSIANGTHRKGPTLRDLRAARSRQWWFPTWFVRTPEEWRTLDHVLVATAVAGGVVLAATIVVIGAAGLH